MGREGDWGSVARHHGGSLSFPLDRNSMVYFFLGIPLRGLRAEIPQGFRTWSPVPNPLPDPAHPLGGTGSAPQPLFLFNNSRSG